MFQWVLFSEELCDVIGLFILNHLHPINDKNEVVWYRNNGLAFINRKSNSMLEKLRKDTFKELGFKITVEKVSKMQLFICYIEHN